MPSTPTINVSGFEGPLGLLLDLVEKRQLEVTDIAVATVTQQYLERVNAMQELSRAELAQFLELGARLLYIKSAALLPIISTTDETSPQAELQALRQELDEYRRYQQAVGHLRRLLANGRRAYERPVRTKLAVSDLPQPEIDLVELGQVFQRALQRAAPLPAKLRLDTHYDQAAIGERIRRQLAQGDLTVSKLAAACRDRFEVIVTFMAILTLVRDGAATVHQSRLFEEIVLSGAPV